MKKKFLFLAGCFLLGVVLNVSAQIYEEHYDQLVNTMDQAVMAHDAEYKEVPTPGAEEDLKPQQQRYEEALKEFNDANEQHFNDDFFKNAPRVVESHKAQ